MIKISNKEFVNKILESNIYHVIATKLNIRDSPLANSKIIGILKYGTKVEISDKTCFESEFENKKGYWLKLENKQSYIFSGFIESLKTKKIDLRDYYSYLK